MLIHRNFFAAAALVGIAVLLWVGAGFVGTNALALLMTVMIGAVYLVGVSEMHRFRQATAQLSSALDAIPDPLPALDVWLQTLPPSLQNAVRLRIEGERVALPGPALTPYLVGLLVMLGMLGTFLGMVLTFNGAVFALEGTTDLPAIRAALAAPIKGLGLAFGTSVAGVAASAMLGLISALSRRERLQVAQRLDGRIGSVLRAHSLVHQRQETFKALQVQAQALPELAAQLQAMMSAMERHQQQWAERLIDQQESFQRDVRAAYAGLADSVARSLDTHIGASVRAAGEMIAPVAAQALAGVATESARLQEEMASSTRRELSALAARIDATAASLTEAGVTSLRAQEASHGRMAQAVGQSLEAFAVTFEQRSGALLDKFDAHYGEVQTARAKADEARFAAWQQALDATVSTLRQEWQQAGGQTLAQQQAICTTLAETAQRMTGQAEDHYRQTLAEISRLLDTAAEAPRVAAEVIGQLRQELSASIARDNTMLEERARLMETLAALLDSINHASREQRATIDALVRTSGEMLEQAGRQQTERMAAESGRLSEVAAQVTGSAVELASLGESFGVAVQRFGETGEALADTLQRVESAIDKSLLRSDEQLAYYVAQAREIIDLSVLSQKEVMEELRRLAGKPALFDEVAG